jgi:hypothetical protein
MLLVVDNLIEKFTFGVLFYVAAFNLNIFLLGGILVTSCDSESTILFCEVKIIFIYFSHLLLFLSAFFVHFLLAYYKLCIM